MNAVVVVGRDVASTLPGVLRELPQGGPLVFVVDDGSTDGTGSELPGGAVLLRHERGRGYGAAQKTGYAAALDAGAERVALLHGDGQYDVGGVLGLLDLLERADVALGSRFLGSDRGGAIPAWRRWGGRVLTGLANARLGIHATDLHTGARAYRASALASLPLSRLSDDYLFDQQVLVALARAGARFAEAPVRVRYDSTVQSIPPGAAIRYGLGSLRVLAGSGPRSSAEERPPRH